VAWKPNQLNRKQLARSRQAEATYSARYSRQEATRQAAGKSSTPRQRQNRKRSAVSAAAGIRVATRPTGASAAPIGWSSASIAGTAGTWFVLAGDSAPEPIDGARELSDLLARDYISNVDASA